MRIIGLAALLLMAAPASAQTPVAMDEFLAAPERWERIPVTLEGVITLEDYAKALFATAQDYQAARYDRSTPLIIPDALIDRREAFERARVRVTGAYDHGCADPGVVCSANPGQGRFLVHALEWLAPPAAELGWRRTVAPTALDRMALADAATQAALEPVVRAAEAAILARDGAALVALAPEPHRAALTEDLADPEGRPAWLLFDGDAALSGRLAYAGEAARRVFVVFETDPATPRVAAACTCFAEVCAPEAALRPEAVTRASTADAHACLTYVEIDGAWRLDPGAILSTWRIAAWGGDRGTEIPRAGNTVGAMFTTPSLPGAYFDTRLRERPRQRVAEAIETQRLDMSAFQMSPEGHLWGMEHDGTGLAVTARGTVGE